MGYTDSDYADDLDNRRSTSGYVFTMAGGAVSWRSRLQTCVTQSTTKHVDVKYHLIKEMVEDKQVQLVKVHTTDNPADLWSDAQLICLWIVADGATSVTIVSFPGPNAATPTLSGVLYLPSGYSTSTATFPAMVLMHGCSGIWSNRNVSARNRDNSPNLQNHIEKWGLKLAGQAIVALVVDSFTIRNPVGVDSREWQDQCGSPDPSVDSYTVRVLDARVAYAYLINTTAGLAPGIPSRVNSARVGLLGWSQGAQTVMTEAADSRSDSSTLRPDTDFLFRLPSITFYPGCGANLGFRTGSDLSGSFWHPKFALRLNIGTLDDFYIQFSVCWSVFRFCILIRGLLLVQAQRQYFKIGYWLISVIETAIFWLLASRSVFWLAVDSLVSGYWLFWMSRQKIARQWDKSPYEVDELSTNEKSHIPDEVLAQIPAHIFIAKFRDEEGDNVKTTVMPREIWTLHRRPAVHLEQFFRLLPWGTDYMRAHELMSSIQYDGKAMLTDSDGSKVEVLITKEIINETLQFQPGTYDLIPKTKAIANEKAFLKVKDNKFKYSDLIYSKLELPLQLISQHLRVQKPPRYTEPFLHMAVVMALCVAERRQVRCDYGKFILETLIEANLKNSAKNKLYMSAGSMLTRVAYQALGMIKDLPAASSQAALIQQAKYVPKAVKTTSSAASSRSTRSRKSSSDEERTDTDKDQDSQESDHEDIPKETEAAGPSEFEGSDEEDTSTPLEKKSQKPRSREQVLMDEAMARIEARRKELADARAAKAAKTAKPTTMEEARKLRMEKAKALQKERKRLEAKEKAQEEAEAAQAA
ncbi:hypothetical protein L7F22_038415 [Adiantum nelumboides]|nr:hypothetical protein [Adiantum nelumboides]